MVERDFGFPNSKFNIDVVAASVDDADPKEFLEFTPIDSDIKDKFIVGEFTMTDKTYDNGDGQLKFTVIFNDKTVEESDKLCSKHINTINKLVQTLFAEFTETSV